MTHNTGNIIEIDTLKNVIFSGARLMGLDLGTKTLGLAISDTSLSVASPLKTLKRKKFTLDAVQLLSLIEEFNVAALIIGWPLNMDGSEGPRTQATTAFIRNMKQKTSIPFVLWDERLSTVAAERVMIEADMSRAKRAEKIDAAAAGFILQGALDRLNQL